MSVTSPVPTSNSNPSAPTVAIAKINNNPVDDDRANSKLQSPLLAQSQQQQKSQHLSQGESFPIKQSNGSLSQLDTIDLNVNMANKVNSTINNDPKQSCPLDLLQQIDKDPAVRLILEQLIGKIVAALDRSNTKQQQQACPELIAASRQSASKTASKTSDNVCTSDHTRSTPLTDQVDIDSTISARHVSLSPDEASGDLVIDSDLPSSAGQQETSDETEQADSSSQDEKDKSPIEEKAISTARSNSSTSDIVPHAKQPHPDTSSSEQPELGSTTNGSKTTVQVKSNVKSEDKKCHVQSPSTLLRPTTKISNSSGTSLLKSVQIGCATETTPDSPLDGQEKDIVALRKLEITPPPPSSDVTSEKRSDSPATNAYPPSQQPMTSTQKSAKRKKLTTTPPVALTKYETDDESKNSASSRSKRQRTQTKLFQAGEVSYDEDLDDSLTNRSKKPRISRQSTSTSRKSSIAPSPSPVEQRPDISATKVVQRTDDQQDVIFYEKNDYLAIRNEENTYYLCQLMENVRSNRPTIRVKWLDTTDEGKTYFLTSQFDMIPQKSIIMPVVPNKLKTGRRGEQVFALDDQVKDNIMERLKRSLGVVSSSQETVTDEL